MAAREARAQRIHPEDAFIRRLDPDWIEVKTDLGKVQEQMLELTKSSHRQERYLVGGWSEDGATWVEGVRDKIERLEKITRWFWAIAAGVWTICVAVIYEIIKGGIIHL